MKPYTHMSNNNRNKSFSHDRLLVTTSFFLPQRSPYFLFRIRNTEPSQESSFKKKIRLTNENSNTNNKKLQEFKKQLIAKLNSSKDMSKKKSFEDLHSFGNKSVDQQLVESEPSEKFNNEFTEGSVFIQSKETKEDQFKNEYLSMFRKLQSNKNEKRFGEKSLKQLQDKAKRTKSIVIIRKMNEMKEKLVLSKKERLQQEFYKRKQTPIHHSKSINFKKTYKKQIDEKNKSRNRNAIQDILKVSETMSKTGLEVFKRSNQNQSFEVIVQGQARFDQNVIFKRNHQSIKMSVQEYKNRKKKASIKEKIMEKGNFIKRDEQIGPWIKVKNSDFSFQF